MKPLRPSAKAILIENRRLLAVQMLDKDGDWYMLPGGGVHFGETLHDALRRECREELGVDVEIGKLRFVREYIARNHEFAEEEADAHQIEYMFDCRVVDAATLGRGTNRDKGQLGLAWLPIESLEEYRFYPKALRGPIRRMDSEPLPTYLGDVN